jgi:hypothetical protein
MEKTIFLLQMCLYPTNGFSLTRGKDRIQQYVNGLTRVFEYNDIIQKNSIDVLIFDNSIQNSNDLPIEIIEILPTNVTFLYANINNYGCINKGAGLIESWLYLQEIIINYKWIIHFEPRQLLINFEFINNFLNNPRSLFTYSQGIEESFFNTGLFCIKSDILQRYINQVDLNNMLNAGISIEKDIYIYLKNNNILFDITDKLNLKWHDQTNNNYYIN